MGDPGNAGDLAGALEAYIRAVDIAERLVAADPDNTGFQCDLAVARRRRCLGGLVTCGLDGHRLFTANDREATGITRFLWEAQDSESGWRTTRIVNNRDCQDSRIANPLVAGSSPARPTMVFQSVRLPCPICPGALSQKRRDMRVARASRSFSGPRAHCCTGIRRFCMRDRVTESVA